MKAYSALASGYDTLMDDIDYDSWADYLHNILKKHSCGKNLLEAACGTGNITARMCRLGYSVTATDISEDMLLGAREKLSNFGVKANLVQQDMRKITCAPRDALICACDGVNYLLTEEDIKSFFVLAHACLKRGGILLFDISTRNKLKNLIEQEFFYDDRDDITCFWRTFLDKDGLNVNIDLTLFIKKGNVYVRTDESQSMRAFDVEEILVWLKESGFCSSNAYSFLTEQPPCAIDDRIQFVAVKAD